MNREDAEDAVDALIACFECQNISMDDAVPILSATLVHVILALAQERNKDPYEGMRLMAEGMMTAMKMRLQQ